MQLKRIYIKLNRYSEYLKPKEALTLFDISLQLANSIDSDEMKELISLINEHRVRVSIASSSDLFPPPLQSIPPKPMFFDIAFEELKFPSIHYTKPSDKKPVEQKPTQQEPKEEKSKGGWFSGWF